MTVIHLKDVIDRIPGATMTLWNEMCAIIAKKLEATKGIRVPKFARFTFSKLDTSVRIVSFEDRFKKGLRSRGIAYPREIPCSDLSYVELGNRVGLSKDACMQLIGHILHYMYGLASRGERLEIHMEGVGRFWAKSSVVGLRYYTDMKNKSKNLRRRSNAGDRQKKEEDAMCLVGKSELRSVNDDDASSDAEDDPAARTFDEKNDPPESPMPNIQENSNDYQPEKGDQIDILLTELRERRDQDSGTIVEASSRSPFAKFVPSYLVPHRHTKNPEDRARQVVTVARYKRGVDEAYERFHSTLEKEHENLDHQHASIHRRLKEADTIFREKFDRKEKEKSEYLDLLRVQAEARVRSDAEERRRRTKDVDDGSDPSARSFPPQEGNRSRQQIKQIQQEVSRVLKRQMRRRKERERDERAKRLAEENFFLKCVKGQILDNRESRRRRKENERAELRLEWSRQVASDAAKRDLMKKLYGPA